MISGTAINGIRMGIAAQKAWSETPLTEERIHKMATFLTHDSEATYEAFVAHTITDTVVTADD